MRGLPRTLNASPTRTPAAGWFAASVRSGAGLGASAGSVRRALAQRALRGPRGRGGLAAQVSAATAYTGAYACYARGLHVFPSIAEARSGDFGSSQVAAPLVPPTAVKFAGRGASSSLLAVADEDGTVTVLDTAGRNEATTQREWWIAHNNAIFDLAWAADARTIVTASGDQNCKLWDTETGLCKKVLAGHRGSVKSVTFAPGSPSLLASSARDGAIMLWDARAAEAGPVVAVPNAHVLMRYQRARRMRKLEANQSVTAVRFAADDVTLFSAGAIDGLMKIWDVRALRSARKPTGAAVAALLPSPFGAPSLVDGGPGSAASSRYGLVALDMSPDGASVLVSQATTSSIYVYSMADMLAEPATAQPRLLLGHRTRSFYVKSAFMPSGEFVVSGSSDGGVYLWNYNAPAAKVGPGSSSALLPFMVLRGHDTESTAVDGCAADPFKLASGSDDNTVRVWDLAPSPEHAAADAPLPEWVSLYSTSGFDDAAACTLPPMLAEAASELPPASPTFSPLAARRVPSPRLARLSPTMARDGQSSPLFSPLFSPTAGLVRSNPTGGDVGGGGQASITQFFNCEPPPPAAAPAGPAGLVTSYFRPLKGGEPMDSAAAATSEASPLEISAVALSTKPTPIKRPLSSLERFFIHDQTDDNVPPPSSAAATAASPTPMDIGTKTAGLSSSLESTRELRLSSPLELESALSSSIASLYPPARQHDSVSPLVKRRRASLLRSSAARSASPSSARRSPRVALVFSPLDMDTDDE
ncbi:cell division cycle protein cdt2 [Thecamonas trahens ATCC 50062]|uniref:Cell division cycle protein cdt2 n=1 Tax=Thecamonas trahens ATCC 50062 TaxID=461836 RepID=A0A0L0D6D4_THETB|nr:cell division cycle protein cdt2 [Thecamonas trahens ATCC 50062]KNC47760.1 cell division cycle protein cdt2 [Thecamonas trahens ATCC 50062]|eukprot:XP_013759238.1 cell division cycle protein cdt2 [Thecamonas trahens ATCC 50062]